MLTNDVVSFEQSDPSNFIITVLILGLFSDQKLMVLFMKCCANVYRFKQNMRICKSPHGKQCHAPQFFLGLVIGNYFNRKNLGFLESFNSVLYTKVHVVRVKKNKAVIVNKMK